MKKLTVSAMIASLGIAGTLAVPVQAADMNQISSPVNNYAVVCKTASPEELKKILSEVNSKVCNIYFNWKDCGTIPPEESQPDADKPVTDQPGADSSKPDTDTANPDGNTGNSDTDTAKPDGNTGNPDTDTAKPDENTGNSDAQDNIPENSFAKQIVNLVNAERTKAGLGTLVQDKGIESAALVRAKEIETSFSHTRPNGSSFSTVLTESGITYKGSGENIAWGQRTPEEVMNGWMNSEGHRANILNPKFTKIGVGYYQNTAGKNYWTQLFTY